MSDPVTRHLSSELRNLARLAAQWADVLDNVDASTDVVPWAGLHAEGTPQSPPPEAARESGDKPETGAGTGGTGQPAAANRPPPVVFSCAMCGARTVWRVEGYAKPWPGALCSNCYAEMRMRRDEIQDVVVGYTGVR